MHLLLKNSRVPLRGRCREPAGSCPPAVVAGRARAGRLA